MNQLTCPSCQSVASTKLQKLYKRGDVTCPGCGLFLSVSDIHRLVRAMAWGIMVVYVLGWDINRIFILLALLLTEIIDLAVIYFSKFKQKYGA